MFIVSNFLSCPFHQWRRWGLKIIGASSSSRRLQLWQLKYSVYSVAVVLLGCAKNACPHTCCKLISLADCPGTWISFRWYEYVVVFFKEFVHFSPSTSGWRFQLRVCLKSVQASISHDLAIITQNSSSVRDLLAVGAAAFVGFFSSAGDEPQLTRRVPAGALTSRRWVHVTMVS